MLKVCNDNKTLAYKWNVRYICHVLSGISRIYINDSIHISNSAYPDEMSSYFISVFTVCPFIVSGPQRVENRGPILKAKRISTYTRYCDPQMDGNCN